MRTKRSFFNSQQNIAALGLALLFFLASLLFLLRSPRPGMIDSGLYDLILPKLGLERGSYYTEAEYYTQPNEQFTISQLPWGGILQLTTASSLVYPAALTSIICTLFGKPFSTVTLAVVIAALLSVALFFLVKSLYALFGSWGVFAGCVWSIMLFYGNYLLFFNSLYYSATFVLMLTAFAAAVFRAFALLRLPEHGSTSIWLPVAVTALWLVTATELSVLLAIPAVILVLYIGMRAVSGLNSMLRKVAVVVVAILLAACTIRFASQNGQIFNRTNLYHSFFDGVLTVCDDPEQTLAEFGMDTNLVQDVGKSAYLSEDNYYISPNGDDADKIFSHISYLDIVAYYFSHPVAFMRLASSALSQAGHIDTSRCVSVTNSSEKALCGDYWDIIRNFFYSGSSTVVFIAVCCIAVGVFCIVRRKLLLGGLLLAADFSGWFVLATMLVGSGTADVSTNLFYFQVLFDLQLCLLLTLVAFTVNQAVYYVAYSDVGVRQKPEPIFARECYAPIELPESPLLDSIANGAYSVVTDPGRFALAASAVCMLVMVYVIYIPRIGAYNNGDFGRMMDAMGVVFTPEDYFNPSVQMSTKVIEDYDFLEPYDWTIIRPGNFQLTQAWISALMRILYELANVPFSTAIIAGIHVFVITLCFYNIVLASHRHWGWKPALLGSVLYIFIFCGSYNMGWLNSLFGEGIAFVGLMMLIATSVCTIESNTVWGRRFALILLAFACIYLACAKAQYALFAPLLILWWAVLAIATASNLKKKLISLVATGLVTALMASYAIGVYSNNDSISSQDTLYSGLCNGILLYADDPVVALEELGLDTGLAADKGKHPYLSADQYYCTPRTEMAEELIYSKVSSVDYLIWYLKHPKAFLALLNDTAAASADSMPDFNLYVGEYTTESHRTVNKFNLWAQVRSGFVPKLFVLYVLLFGAIYVAAFVIIFRRSEPKAKKLYAGLLIILIALGAIQYPLPMVGNGHSDPIKQLYLFREVYDMVFLLLVVWGVFRLIPRLYHLCYRPRVVSHDENINQPEPNQPEPKKGKHYAGT